MTVLEDAMKEHMAFIVLCERRPFSYKDFHYFIVDGKPYKMAHGTFRNQVSKMIAKGEVEIHTKTNPTFYTLAGHGFGKKNLMTENHREDVISTQQLIHNPIYNILESTSFDNRTLHNIHLKFKVSNLHGILASNTSLCEDFIHKGITIPYFDIDEFTVIITVYKNNTITVVLGCSENPVTLDFNGINRLTTALTRIEERLSNLIIPFEFHLNRLHKDKIIIPSHRSWTITLWHLGRDSLSEYSKERFHCKWDIAEKIALRIYIKELTSGKKKVRIELQQNPSISIETLQKAILNKILE